MLLKHSKLRGGTALLTLFATLVLTAPVARAESPTAPLEGPEGWRKVIAYASCAFQVFAAVTPVQVVAAAATCGKLLADEPPIPTGGD